jgi:hypothetical protein
MRRGRDERREGRGMIGGREGRGMKGGGREECL